MYLQTGSLWSCVAMHAFYNIVAFVNQYYFDFHRIRTIDQIQDLHDWLPELSMLAVSLTVLLILMQRYGVLLSCRSVGSYPGAEIT